MGAQFIEGEAARALGRREKWELLSPFLKQHGREALAYATLQAGMEYFITARGYLAYTTVTHPVFARRPKQIVFSDPVGALADQRALIEEFREARPRFVFVCISEACAATLRGLGFKANCVGYESLLPVQTYNTKGNWKELDLIKRARNEAKREGLTIREEPDIARVDREQLAAVSKSWIGGKPVNDREIWFFARRPVFEHEEDVRKFVAYDREGRVAGFAFYDPIYRDGRVCGYAANILRSDERRFGRLPTALHMEAMETFKPEGKEVLNLLLAPCVNLEGGAFNDDWISKLFFRLCERYGHHIYNFRGLSFHKAKYRGQPRFLYFASDRAMPSNDIYLAYHSADIARSYFSTIGRLVWGMVTAKKQPGPDSNHR
jgi:phosphatidylglycerol lysyltransferase